MNLGESEHFRLVHRKRGTEMKLAASEVKAVVFVRSREVLLGKQDLLKSGTAPASGWNRLADGSVVY
jgi:hypothetical protein